MCKNRCFENGFTLIEIIIVLVLLGILAATAVPKYFDLQEASEKKAALSAVAEAQSRINLRFGQLIMQGNSCKAAAEEVNEISKLGGDGTGNLFGDFILGANTITAEGTEVSAQRKDSGTNFPNLAKLYLPACETADTASDAGGSSSTGTGGSSSAASEDPYISQLVTLQSADLAKQAKEHYGVSIAAGSLVTSNGKTYVVLRSGYLSSSAAEKYAVDGIGNATELTTVELDTSASNWAQQDADNHWSSPLGYGRLYKDASTGTVYAFAGNYTTQWEAVPPAGNWVKLVSSK